MKKFVCFHLYNDFSGSPKVLRQVVRGMLEEGHEVVLVTSRGGVLDNAQCTTNGLELKRKMHNAQLCHSVLILCIVHFAL